MGASLEVEVQVEIYGVCVHVFVIRLQPAKNQSGERRKRREEGGLTKTTMMMRRMRMSRQYLEEEEVEVETTGPSSCPATSSSRRGRLGRR